MLNQLKPWKTLFRWAVGLLSPLLLVASIALAQTSVSSEPPAIEWLQFQVPADRQAEFIRQDAAIWTPVLGSYPGFQHKEIWTSPENPDELVIVTHWASFAQWQAIPQAVLDRTTEQFQQAVGAAYTPKVRGFRLAWRSKP